MSQPNIGNLARDHDLPTYSQAALLTHPFLLCSRLHHGQMPCEGHHLHKWQSRPGPEPDHDLSKKCVNQLDLPVQAHLPTWL